MNHCGVGNKCEKKAEARDLPPAASREEKKTRPEEGTIMEGTSLCLSFVILLLQCSPSVPVTVSTTKHKVEVREFSDAVLTCLFRTERDQSPRIEWKKRGKDVSFVYFDGQFRGPFEGRATISGATVTLQRVTQEDAGEYRCEISAPLDSVSLGETNVTLKVLVPPHTPSCQIPGSAVTGSVVQLRCQDQQSIPPATYSWFKNNMPLSQPRQANATYVIDSRTGVLEFRTVAKEDTGRYSCLASNGVGPPKMCEGKHMTIEDVNITAIVAAVVVVCLVVVVCGCGGVLLHRNGFFSRHRGRSFWISQCHGADHISSQTLHTTEDTSNVNYIPPPQEPQDFKHTQSFML
ncbi:LOW QUALITY PROTEIN: junctional adhesion molecule 2A [Solea solea]|uniref:LOW QUALITY PROTEIN: junctional adhesion molecule 2A n=1 Tax=Solea solea TaxID=90069 RepID=UPI00272CA7C9|nr:LOW QUALITY PROTEIN: junctional adhesion molecule 2A [Solea solea]